MTGTDPSPGPAPQDPAAVGLDVLVADDERPVLDELVALLRRDARVRTVLGVATGSEALRELSSRTVDAAFLDIHMPGLTGLELADVLRRFKVPPAAVFVSAHDQHGVDAFDLNAVDYVLKPVRAERLAEAVRRVLAAREQGEAKSPPEDDAIAVERGGVTRLVHRSDIRHVEAEGDYARLHTATESHLVRIPLSTLEQDWAETGFVRIHRSSLVSLRYVTGIRTSGGRTTVLLHDVELPVSRRLAPALRARLRG